MYYYINYLEDFFFLDVLFLEVLQKLEENK